MEKKNNEFLAILCIDAVENNISSGRFYWGNLSEEQSFMGLDQFLLTMDALMDSAEDSGAPVEQSGAVWHPGKIATFKLQVLFRRNASWQGSVMWLETRHEENFRSVLELMSIINQALVPAQKQRMCPSSLKITKQ